MSMAISQTLKFTKSVKKILRPIKAITIETHFLVRAARDLHYNTLLRD